MGNSRGSGATYYHWWRPTKKTTVDDCLSLDANRSMREGILRAGVHAAGSWRWTYPSGSSFCVHYDVRTLDMDRPRMRLSYSWTWGAEGEPQSADYHVRLATTRPRFGGLRWWFVCPLLVRGQTCNRRVGKLYLPSRQRYFGCRRCHDLTYASAQTHDKRVDALRRNPDLIERDPGRRGGESSWLQAAPCPQSLAIGAVDASQAREAGDGPHREAPVAGQAARRCVASRAAACADETGMKPGRRDNRMAAAIAALLRGVQSWRAGTVCPPWRCG